MRCLLAPLGMIALVACSAPPAAPVEPVPAGAVATPSPPRFPGDLVVSTNEPFWQVRVEGAALVLTGPEGGRTFSVRGDSVQDGRRTLRGADGQGSLVVAVTGLHCVDDMSGASFPFSATLSIDGGAAVSGCGRSASEPQPRPDQ